MTMAIIGVGAIGSYYAARDLQLFVILSEAKDLLDL